MTPLLSMTMRDLELRNLRAREGGVTPFYWFLVADRIGGGERERETNCKCCSSITSVLYYGTNESIKYRYPY